MIVVIDTSVWISTLGAKHKNYTLSIVKHAQKGHIKFLSSEETWAEFEDVLARPKTQKWLSLHNPNYTSFVDTIKSLVVTKKVDVNSLNLTHPNYKNLQNRDEKDLKFLYLCDQEQVDILITQDKDLLDLRTHKETKILKPDEALFLIQTVFGNLETLTQQNSTDKTQPSQNLFKD